MTQEVSIDVDGDRALAFRVAANHLGERTDSLSAVAACGIQEYPPGWSPVALLARTDAAPDRAAVVTVNAMRGAPHVVPRADVAIFTRALVPADDELGGLVGSQIAAEIGAAGFGVRDALDRVAEAARAGLAGGSLGRDEFHQAMRERLPGGLLPWCRGCQSHHVRPGLWRALGPLGVTEMPERAVWALAPPQPMPTGYARAELARRFLRCFGPATHSELASWAGTAPAHAKRLFAAIDDELETVSREGRRTRALRADLDRLAHPPSASGVRMLGGFDPYVSQPDRDSLVPDKALRKRLFPAVGRPGIVLSEGRVVALWKSRKRGRVLEIEVQPVGGREPALGELANEIAELRGCERARVVTI